MYPNQRTAGFANDADILLMDIKQLSMECTVGYKGIDMLEVPQICTHDLN